MKRIRIIADEFFKKCKIDTLPISQNKINEILTENNWKLRYYSRSKIIIEHLGLIDYFNNCDGFTYIENNDVIIFIKDNLSYLEKINVISHEIGHLVLGHTSFNGVLGKSKDKGVENILEKEANIFSLEFQAPIFMLLRKNYDTAEKIFDAGILDRDLSEIQYKELLKFKDRLKSKKLIFKYRIELIGMFLIIILFISNITITQKIISHPNKIYVETISKNFAKIIKLTNYDNTSISETTENTTGYIEVVTNYTSENSNFQLDKIVQITKSGKKYHLPNCRYVINKIDTIEINIKDAIKEGYTPCSVCNPK